MKFALSTVVAAVAASSTIEARSSSTSYLPSNGGSLFGIQKQQTKNSFLNGVIQSSNAAASVLLSSPLDIGRGGASDEEEVEEAVEEVALYLPGLLEATVSGKWVSAHVVCVYSTISDD